MTLAKELNFIISCQNKIKYNLKILKIKNYIYFEAMHLIIGVFVLMMKISLHS